MLDYNPIGWSFNGQTLWTLDYCRMSSSSSSSSSSKNEVPSVLYNVHNQNIAEIDSICWLSTETMGKNCLGLILIINLYNQCVLICSWCIVSIIRLFRLHNMHQGFLARRKCKNAIIPVWCQWCGAMVRKLTTAGK